VSAFALDLPPHGTHRVIEPGPAFFGGTLTLVSTVGADGRPHVRPFSACMPVGDTLWLGFERDSTTRTNLLRATDCVVNVPQADLAPALRAFRTASMAGTAGSGFASMGLTAVPSELVRAPRVRECYLQLECELLAMHPASGGVGGFAELAVRRIHAVDDIVLAGTERIDGDTWRPLLYSFRRFFTLTATG
jgi:flavin reductase (DIM6/NTAB) family NADH-FMN oxidoreductase RutF